MSIFSALFTNRDFPVLVDFDDVPCLSPCRWWLDKDGYAVTKIQGKRYRMHRMILGLADYADRTDVDHINGNRSDNRRENLRIVPHRVNCQNRTSPPKSRTGFLGVSVRSNGRFQAVGTPEYGFSPVIGTYVTAREAAEAFDRFVDECTPGKRTNRSLGLL